jgi:GT2 family glycosyltransferase
MFCVFLLKRFAFERVGRFDERFYPAYFEDNDYHRRMKLAGIKEAFVEDTGYEHVGSATLKSFSPEETQEHHRNFVRLRELYVLKWGGLPGAEIYETPAI